VGFPPEFWPIAGWALAFLLAYLAFLDGPITRRFMNREPEFRVYPMAPDSTYTGPMHTTLYLTGLGSVGSIHGAGLAREWDRIGPVLICDYARYRFDMELTIAEIYNALLGVGIDQVRVIGASMGGQLAIGLIRYDRALNKGRTRFSYQAILADVPSGARDLLEPHARAKTIWHPGLLGDFLFSRLHAKLTYRPQSSNDWGQGASISLLARLHEAARRWPLSGLIGQLDSILRFRPPKTGEFAGVKTVILKSTGDSVVGSTSIGHLLDAFHDAVVITVAGAMHIDFLEHPDEWSAAFERADLSLRDPH
jgi:pimeloyl-ACP methyl ester carboxylesterase